MSDTKQDPRPRLGLPPKPTTRQQIADAAAKSAVIGGKP